MPETKLCKACRKAEYPDEIPFCSSCVDAGWDQAYISGLADGLEQQRARISQAVGALLATPVRQPCKLCAEAAGLVGTGHDLCDKCWKDKGPPCDSCGCKESVHDRLAPHYKRTDNLLSLCACRKYVRPNELSAVP